MHGSECVCVCAVCVDDQWVRASAEDWVWYVVRVVGVWVVVVVVFAAVVVLAGVVSAVVSAVVAAVVAADCCGWRAGVRSCEQDECGHVDDGEDDCGCSE
eukprot:3556202-Rhodomonas_salina.1